MAVSSRGFLKASSVSILSGSKVVTLTGGVNCSFISSGTAVYINGILTEGVSGTSSNPDGTSTITLRDNWDQESLTNVQLVAFNTIEGLRDAIQGARQFSTNMSDITRSFGEILTSNESTITVNIDGVPTEITPYGFLSGEVTDLVAQAGGAADTLVDLQQDVEILSRIVSGIQADLLLKIEEASGYAQDSKEWSMSPEDVEVEFGNYSSLHWANKSEGFSDSSSGFSARAEEWANKAEGVSVTTGKYSAFHWANKAEDFSNSSSGFSTTSKNWAINPVDVVVSAGGYSSFHWASKSSDFAGASLAHSNKSDNWANLATDTIVEGGRYSSRHWSDKSKDQKDIAEKWATNPENSAVTTGKYSALHWANKSEDFATDSEISKNLSEEWAENPVDVVVSGGGYSSFHWSEKARQQAEVAALYGSNSFADGGNVSLASGNYPAVPPVATQWRVDVGGTVLGILYKAGETLAYSKQSNTFYRLEVLAGTSWGSVTGTLSNQTDLNTALSSKVASTNKATKSEAEAGTNDTKWMTPLRVLDSIKKQVVPATSTVAGIVTTTTAFTDSSTTKVVTGKGLVDGLATKAGTGHQHPASDIISGILDNDRLAKATTLQQGIVQLSTLINGQSETKAVTEKALSDGLSEPSDTVITYLNGDVVTMTEVFPLGSKVTTFSYIEGNLVSSSEDYLGITKTTTYTYDISGNLEGVSTV